MLFKSLLNNFGYKPSISFVNPTMCRCISSSSLPPCDRAAEIQAGNAVGDLPVCRWGAAGLMGIVCLLWLYHRDIRRTWWWTRFLCSATVFQFSYTAVFGAYTAFIFIRTGEKLSSACWRLFLNDIYHLNNRWDRRPLVHHFSCFFAQLQSWFQKSPAIM